MGRHCSANGFSLVCVPCERWVFRKASMQNWINGFVLYCRTITEKSSEHSKLIGYKYKFCCQNILLQPIQQPSVVDHTEIKYRSCRSLLDWSILIVRSFFSQSIGTFSTAKHFFKKYILFFEKYFRFVAFWELKFFESRISFLWFL